MCSIPVNRYVAMFSAAVLLLAGGYASAELTDESVGTRSQRPPKTIRVDNDDLQRVVDAAPPHSTVVCNSNRQRTLSAQVTIRKPITIQGINARLPDGLGNTALLVVESEGVSITDFELTGNADTVNQAVRSPLIIVHAGNFRIERGTFINSAKDGVMVNGPGAKDGDIVGGVVRDVVGRGVVRDVVSIGGGGAAHTIRNVLVDNVRAYDSSLRGAVEVSDGTANITVRNVYAERCVYAVDVQDHGKPDEINTNVLIEDVRAFDCKHAVRTANHPHGHSNLTIRDVMSERCAQPLKISNTCGLTLENVRIADHPAETIPVTVTRCDNVWIHGVAITNSAHAGPGIVVDDCNEVLIDGIGVHGDASALTAAVIVRVSTEIRGLHIHNVSARGVKEAGIILEKSTDAATISEVIISENRATVIERSGGLATEIERNVLPPK
ncbi:MAG: hypothetical protein HUU46_18615 [Candidatus Hydrogenedentes bacterium]|nr:hypothetical protein [Candidatus Hydrogenedentota bacterium]